MPLKASQVKGTLLVLKPEFRRFSPALGLVALGAPAFVNNLYSCTVRTPLWGLSPSCDLAREAFFTRDPAVEEPRPCRNPSKPIAYTTPRVLGHILGLAVSRASEADVQKTLKENGIETNRVNGTWTGVSLARFKRLVSLIREAYQADEATPAVPLLTRIAWEKAEGKQDLLDFYRALSLHLGPVFNDEHRGLIAEDSGSSAFSESFIEDAFTIDELQDEDAIGAASSHLAGDDDGRSPEYARHLELIAASLSQAQAFKPAWKILRHTYKGGKQVPDCVEVTVREFIDLLLYDADRDSFDLSRLPSSANKELRAFYEGFTRFTDELTRSRAWFSLCQEIPGCEYISETDGGRIKYELFPSIKNVISCIGHLLGRPEWGHDLKAFAQGYESFRRERGGEASSLEITERREMFRAALAEESRRREIMTVGFVSSPHYLEITLEGAHRLATVKHCRRSQGKWVQESRPSHLRRMLSSHPNQSSYLLRSVFWPAFLQDSALLGMDVGHTNPATSVLAILSTRWGHDRRRWDLGRSTLTAEVTPNEERLAMLASTELTLKAFSAVQRDEQLGEFLLWIAQRAPANLPPAELLKVVNLKDARWQNSDLIQMLEDHGNPMCARLLRGDLHGMSLLTRFRYYFAR